MLEVVETPIDLGAMPVGQRQRFVRRIYRIPKLLYELQALVHGECTEFG